MSVVLLASLCFLLPRIVVQIETVMVGDNDTNGHYS